MSERALIEELKSRRQKALNTVAAVDLLLEEMGVEIEPQPCSDTAVRNVPRNAQSLGRMATREYIDKLTPELGTLKDQFDTDTFHAWAQPILGVHLERLHTNTLVSGLLYRKRIAHVVIDGKPTRGLYQVTAT